jgi:hypothetical protein
MKLSNDTLTILKNFAAINSGLEFKAGNQLTTISPGKTVLAKVTLKDSFPEDFCVYDLPQFLSVHSLNKDPEIDFDEYNIIFKSGKSKIKYRKTAREMIITPPDKVLALPTVDVAFKLTDEVFSSIMKSASVLQSPHIAVESNGGTIHLTCFDAKDDSAHTNSIDVGDVAEGDFRLVFLTENLKMIPGSYDVEISSKGLASFKNTIQEVDYWIAIEAKESNFEG